MVTPACSCLSWQRYPEGRRDASGPSEEDPQQCPDDACTDEPDPVGGGLTLGGGLCTSCIRNARFWVWRMENWIALYIYKTGFVVPPPLSPLPPPHLSPHTLTVRVLSDQLWTVVESEVHEMGGHSTEKTRGWKQPAAPFIIFHQFWFCR